LLFGRLLAAASDSTPRREHVQETDNQIANHHNQTQSLFATQPPLAGATIVTMMLRG
jgi:hypothetical protein